MKNLNIFSKIERSIKRIPILLIGAIMAVALVNSSCEDEFQTDPVNGTAVVASSNVTSVQLNQKLSNKEAVNLSWTRGNNQGTGAAILYTLEVSLDDDFANSVTYDLGKGVYSKGFTHSALNELVVNTFGATSGSTVQLKYRVIASVPSQGLADDVSAIQTVEVKSYVPVSSTLYLVGSATANGWSADNATPMVQDSEDPTIFSYQGTFNVGDFKFLTSLGSFLPSYNKGADEFSLVYRTADTDPDVPFSIAKSAIYRMSVDLVNLTISIVEQTGPAYSQLYMVGSATPNGWDIANAVEMTQNPDNLFQFTWEGVLKAGEFKIPVNRNTDWGQPMYMPDEVDVTKTYLHQNGDGIDRKWQITKECQYKVVIDLQANTISIVPFKLYMVGSATPIGWDISNSVELVQDATDWQIFTYTGPLVSGEMKFPVNRNSDWGQDMYMRNTSDDTKMYLHIGGQSDDNKWNITTAGDYVVTLNIRDLTISFVKQ